MRSYSADEFNVLDELHNLLSDIDGDAVLRLSSAGTKMGRANDGGMLHEGSVLGGLILEAIDACAAALAAL